MFNIACFLGNDFLPRSNGNGEKRAIEFINQISNENGDVVKSGEDLDQTVLSYTKEVSKDESVQGKRKRSQEEHNECLIEWNLSKNMFKGGPAFRITTEESKLVRTAFVSDTYNVELTDYSGTNQTFEYGFNALEPFSKICTGNQSNIRQLFIDCFKMKVWCNTFENVEASPFPTVNGRQVYHGSILDFIERPINSYGVKLLKFWLSARQISPEVAAYVKNVNIIVTDKLQPIPTEMMRGSGGYVAP